MSEAIDVLLVCKDLFFTSQLHGAAQRAGRVSRTCLSQATCLDQLQQERQSVRYVVVDLELPQLDLDAIRSAAGADVRLIAFGPHVRTELFATASQAGCDAVLTRGQATAGVEEMLRGS